MRHTCYLTRLALPMALSAIRIVPVASLLLLPLALSAAFAANGRAASPAAHEAGLAASHSPAADNPARPFATRRDPSGWWLVAPDGEKFFSLGICCLHQGAPREASDPENPSYAAWRNHP